MSLKSQIEDLKQSSSAFNRSIFYLLKRIWLLWKFFLDAPYRSRILTKVRFGKGYFQQPINTSQNRYPLIFQECANYLSSVPKPKILSLGCSTGEEVLSIGQHIPGAHILGVDINPWCIRQAKNKATNPNHVFVQRFSKEFESSDGFDAIFCMAVFQSPENRYNKDNSQTEGIRFEQFEQEINFLDSKLKSGGLLIIDNADFRFSDTAVSQHYSPLSTFDKNSITRNRPVFDRDNRKISEKNDSYRVFVKN